MDNIEMRGSTVIGKYFYDSNCEKLEITPSTVNEDGVDMQIDVENLVDSLYENIRPRILGDVFEANNLKIASEELQLKPNEVEWVKNSCMYLRSSTRRFIYSLFANDILKDTSIYEKMVNKYYEFDHAIEGISVRTIIDTIGAEEVNRSGRFTKRFTSYLNKLYHIKLSDALVSAIGNIYNQNRLVNKTFYTRITNNFTWDDGQYGKNGSCWWGCYTDSRDTLYYHGGYAFLFYDSARMSARYDGIGRVWAYPISDDLVIIFNPYGVQGKEGAAVVAKYLESVTGSKWTYGKREVDNCSKDPHYPYINGDNGRNNDGGSKCYVVYCQNRPESRIKFSMKRVSGIFSQSNLADCVVCGGTYDYDEMHTNDYGDPECNECWDSHDNDEYSYCTECGCAVPTGDTYTLQDCTGVFCRSCWRTNRGYRCARCGGDYRHRESAVRYDALMTVCPSCYTDIQLIERINTDTNEQNETSTH